MDFETDPFATAKMGVGMEPPMIFESERQVIEEDVEMEENHTIEHFHEQRFY